MRNKKNYPKTVLITLLNTIHMIDDSSFEEKEVKTHFCEKINIRLLMV